MSLKSLRVYAAVMEHGSLTRAADELHMSQSAASRQLQLLEERFGIALFDRQRRNLVATAQAEALFPEVMRILSQYDALPDLFGESAPDAMPPLRVICHPRLVDGLIIPTISRFSKAHEGLRVKLDVQPRRDLGRRVMSGLFDVGVSALPAPSDDVTVTALGSARLGFLLPGEHPLAGQSMLEIADVKLPYIALDGTTLIRRFVDAALDASGSSLPILHEVSTGAAAYQLVAQGMGFTFADRVALPHPIPDAVRLVPWARGSEVSYGAFYNKALPRHPATDAFEEALLGRMHEIDHST